MPLTLALSSLLKNELGDPHIIYYWNLISIIRCNFLQNLQNSVELFRTTLNFHNLKVTLNPLHRIFLNTAESCTFTCLSWFNNKKGVMGLFLSYKSFKLILRGFLGGHIVAMVTWWFQLVYQWLSICMILLL